MPYQIRLASGKELTGDSLFYLTFTDEWIGVAGWKDGLNQTFDRYPFHGPDRILSLRVDNEGDPFSVERSTVSNTMKVELTAIEKQAENKIRAIVRDEIQNIIKRLRSVE